MKYVVKYIDLNKGRACRTDIMDSEKLISMYSDIMIIILECHVYTDINFKSFKSDETDRK